MKNMQGELENDRLETPLFYGIEKTTKSDEDGLYFMLVHKLHKKYARETIRVEIITIYQASNKYKSCMPQLNSKFNSPYLISYQESSNRIANNITNANGTNHEDI
jgi:hypothetical protein